MATRRYYSNIDLNGLKITSVGTPTAATDVSSKEYVDLTVTDRVDGASTTLTQAYEQADAALRAALEGADTANLATVRGEFASADQAVRDAFAAADADLEARLSGQASAASTTSESTLRSEFQAADNTVRTEFAAADAALRDELTTAAGNDAAAIRSEFAAADTTVRSALEAALAQEATDRTAADTDLTNRVQSLDASVVAADNQLRTDIQNAVNAQQAGDTAIRGEFAAADAANLTTVRDELAAADAALRAYTESSIASLTSGQVLKGAVRLAVEENVDLATPPATIQGETLVDGDVVLLTGQTTGTENGPYLYTGTALERAGNWNSDAEARVGSYWVVREGTHADQFALLSNDVFTLGTDVPQFIFIEAIPDPVPPVEQAIGGSPAGSDYTVTHNFGTLATNVSVVETASGQDVTAFISFRKTVNSVVVQPDVALAADELTVFVGRARG